MGRVGGEGKLVTFAKKRLDFKFYLSGSWERMVILVTLKKPGLQIRPGSKSFWHISPNWK